MSLQTGEQLVVLNVEGMSCGHCKAAVEKAVSALNGVSGVDVALAEKKVSVKYDPELVKESDIREAIEDQGYEVK